MELTDEIWKNCHLVIETNKAEKDVRQIFYKENFTEAGLEFVKDGQLGNDLIKKFGMSVTSTNLPVSKNQSMSLKV
ncbi:MAG: hypothetical protein KGH86_08075 [Thaumarchaeota archaeon]|nr:hypothetical protein [Nitrososphaerota archaeon]